MDWPRLSNICLVLPQELKALQTLAELTEVMTFIPLNNWQQTHPHPLVVPATTSLEWSTKWSSKMLLPLILRRRKLSCSHRRPPRALPNLRYWLVLLSSNNHQLGNLAATRTKTWTMPLTERSELDRMGQWPTNIRWVCIQRFMMLWGQFYDFLQTVNGFLYKYLPCTWLAGYLPIPHYRNIDRQLSIILNMKLIFIRQQQILG